MTTRRFITGFGKVCFFIRLALGVVLRYALRPSAFHWSPLAYLRFLSRALSLLLVFRHNKIVRVFNGWKFQLYLPAYPSQAFFYALESKLLRTPPAPITIVYSMTKACSYHCAHCYQQQDSGADIEEALLIATARRIQEAGVAMFDIEGGEPFLRFPRLLALVRAIDGRSDVWVNTTGAQMTEEMLAQLKDAGLFGLMVSIHSPKAVTHDAFTGVPGSFTLACETLRLCRRMGLVAAMNSVLSEQDVRDGGVDRLMELARELACDYVQLIHPKAAGRWLGKETELQADATLLREIERLHLLYNSRLRPDYPSLAAQAFEEKASAVGCTAGGIDRFYVNAYGEVQPCEFLNLSFGNVQEEPFEVIFARMRSYFPEPCTDWLCSKHAGAIHALFQEHGLTRTPLPWAITQQLVKQWDRGEPTRLYAKMGIYR